MKRFTLYLFVLISMFLLTGTQTLLQAQAQDPDWVHTFGGGCGKEILADGSGNIYHGGYISGSVDLDSGPGTCIVGTVTNTKHSFIRKLDKDGNFLWGYGIENIYLNMVERMTVDDAGNVYAIGYFKGNADFDNGPGSFTLTTDSNASHFMRDTFIVKLDASGNLIKAAHLATVAGTGNDFFQNVPAHMSRDSNGNIYVAGFFYGSVDFDPGPGTEILSCRNSNQQAYLVKLDGNLNFQWAYTIDSAGSNHLNAMDVDSAGNIMIAGSVFNEVVDIAPSPATFPVSSYYIMKLNSNGEFLWANDCSYYVMGIKMDGAGNMIFSGALYGTTDLDPGAGIHPVTSVGYSGYFLSKVSAAGDLIWANLFGNPTAGSIGVEDIALDNSGNVLLGGRLASTCTFGSGADALQLTSSGNSDALAVKFNADGDFITAVQFGGAGYDYGFAIACDNAGDAYFTGSFRETADFDYGDGVINRTAGGSGDDIFMIKMEHFGESLPALDTFSLLATNSIYMRTGGKVLDGNIAVCQKNSDPKLSPGNDVTLGRSVFAQDGYTVYGDVVYLGVEASVDNIACNSILGSGTVRGNQDIPLQFPLGISLPVFPSASPGSENIVLAAFESLTLAGGSYGDVLLNKGAVLILSGGTYHFNNLELTDYSDILCSDAVEIIINNRLLSGDRIIIGPESGSSVTAKDILIFVNGQNGAGGDLFDLPKAATLGARHNVKANIYAPNGSVWLKARSNIEGACIAKDILVEFYVNISLNSAF
ncbi:MAG: hypothetical protein GY757_00535 [bacterium]|nr:hypothetical protein [bacterium]